MTKSKARSSARRKHPESSGICALCLKHIDGLERHHWAGYDEKHQNDIWWICHKANVMLAADQIPDGTDLSEVRTFYKLKRKNTQLSLFEEHCELERRFIVRLKSTCKAARTWFDRDGYIYERNYFENMSERKMKREFIKWYIKATGLKWTAIILDGISFPEMLNIAEKDDGRFCGVRGAAEGEKPD